MYAIVAFNSKEVKNIIIISFTLKIYLCMNDKSGVSQCKLTVYQIIKLHGRKNKEIRLTIYRPYPMVAVFLLDYENEGRAIL